MLNELYIHVKILFNMVCDPLYCFVDVLSDVFASVYMQGIALSFSSSCFVTNFC